MPESEIPVGDLQNSAEVTLYFTEMALQFAQEAKQEPHDGCNIEVERVSPKGMDMMFYLGVVAASNFIALALEDKRNFSKDAIKDLLRHVIIEAATEFESMAFSTGRKEGNGQQRKTA